MCKSKISACFIFLFNFAFIIGQQDRNECFRNIHERCLYDQDYTSEELNIAIEWILDKFGQTDPIHPPCKQIYVRKEVKCMTTNELREFAEAYRELNRRGVLKRLVKIHDTYWAAAHKFSEGVNWHLWFNILFQQELFRINKKVVFPYWDFDLESARPEKSIIWRYFGHSGNIHNNFSVTDGLFANMTLFYPDEHILKREWNDDGTISPWECKEWATSILQSSPYKSNLVIPQLKILTEYNQKETVLKSFRDIIGGVLTIYFQIYAVFAVQLSYAAHFRTHLHLGGWHGDLSTAIAPNDPVFYMFHEYQMIRQFKWQLSSKHNFVPRSYDLGVAVDWKTKFISLSNIEKDHLTFFQNISVKEMFQLGYGHNCYIPEQFIRGIIDIINDKRQMPTVVERLRDSLPRHIFTKWFPKFALNPEGYTYFDHNFPEVGDCNPPDEHRRCMSLPVASHFQSTKNGRRQWKRFVEDLGFDMSILLNPIDDNYYEFMKDLKTFNYCSPYVY